MAWVDLIVNYATTGQVVDIPPELSEMVKLPTLTRRDWAYFHILSGHIDAGLDLLDEAAEAGFKDVGLY